MGKRTTLLVLDVSIVAMFVSLLSWRLTGLSLHEAFGLALLALIVVHAGVHWGWMEARAIAALRRTPRRTGELLINTGLFASMGATLLSGVVISKVVFPNSLSPSAYLGWHSVHESATTLTLLFTGLHFAINWERIVTLVSSRGAHAMSWRVPTTGVLVRRALSFVVAIGLLGAALWGYERVSPGPREVEMLYPDGRREMRAPPPEITRRNRDSDQLRPVGGLPRLAMSVLLIAGTAGLGRKLGAARRRAPQYREEKTPPTMS